jgi:hypothetical protein
MAVTKTAFKSSQNIQWKECQIKHYTCFEAHNHGVAVRNPGRYLGGPGFFVPSSHGIKIAKG